MGTEPVVPLGMALSCVDTVLTRYSSYGLCRARLVPNHPLYFPSVLRFDAQAYETSRSGSTNQVAYQALSDSRAQVCGEGFDSVSLVLSVMI